VFLVVAGTVDCDDRTLTAWMGRDPVPAFDFQNPGVGKVNPERLICLSELADLFHRSHGPKVTLRERVFIEKQVPVKIQNDPAMLNPRMVRYELVRLIPISELKVN